MSNEQLKLNNVLYVPNLICNLISVSLLIEESNCIVWLTNNFFFYTGPQFEDADWCG